MSEWEFSDFASKDNLVQTIRRESEGMFDLAAKPETWEAPTAAGHWQVRDVIGHLIDTTEGYFTAFEIARTDGTAPPPLGVRDMNEHVDQAAMELRGIPQDVLLTRAEKDRDEMVSIIEDLDEEAWNGFVVPHKYMGPLPACFYPIAQVVDYAVHSWDIRQGTGRNHALDGVSADLLVPFCWVVWQSTADCTGVDPFTLGVRITGNNSGETRVSVSGDGIALEPGNVDDLPLVLDFDPSSFVLTAMGRINGGTARGDASLVDRFCNLFFRI